MCSDSLNCWLLEAGAGWQCRSLIIALFCLCPLFCLCTWHWPLSETELDGPLVCPSMAVLMFSSALLVHLSPTPAPLSLSCLQGSSGPWWGASLGQQYSWVMVSWGAGSSQVLEPGDDGKSKPLCSKILAKATISNNSMAAWLHPPFLRVVLLIGRTEHWHTCSKWAVLPYRMPGLKSVGEENGAGERVGVQWVHFCRAQVLKVYYYTSIARSISRSWYLFLIP